MISYFNKNIDVHPPKTIATTHPLQHYTIHTQNLNFATADHRLLKSIFKITRIETVERIIWPNSRSTTNLWYYTVWFASYTYVNRFQLAVIRERNILYRWCDVVTKFTICSTKKTPKGIETIILRQTLSKVNEFEDLSIVQIQTQSRNSIFCYSTNTRLFESRSFYVVDLYNQTIRRFSINKHCLHFECTQPQEIHHQTSFLCKFFTSFIFMSVSLSPPAIFNSVARI